MNGGRFKKIFERIHFELRCFKWRRHAKYFLDKETNPDIHRSDTFSFNLWTARNHILGCCPAFSANFLYYLTQAKNMIFVEANLTKPWGRPWVLHSWRVCVPPVAPPFNLWTLWVGALCQNMSSQTLGLINTSSYNLNRMNENFVIDQSFLNQIFGSYWHLCRQILSKMPHLVFVPPQHFWWFLFVNQFCQDMLVGVLFKEWWQCFFVEIAHSWSI